MKTTSILRIWILIPLTANGNDLRNLFFAQTIRICLKLFYEEKVVYFVYEVSKNTCVVGVVNFLTIQSIFIATKFELDSIYYLNGLNLR